MFRPGFRGAVDLSGLDLVAERRPAKYDNRIERTTLLMKRAWYLETNVYFYLDVSSWADASIIKIPLQNQYCASVSQSLCAPMQFACATVQFEHSLTRRGSIMYSVCGPPSIVAQKSKW